MASPISIAINCGSPLPSQVPQSHWFIAVADHAAVTLFCFLLGIGEAI
jgi:hypothetical protein